MIWGATLAAGRQAYLRFGDTPQAEVSAVMAAQKLVKSFRALNKNINCAEITNLDKSSSAMQMVTFFLLKGGFIGCLHKTAKYASAALGEIESGITEEINKTPSRPISCTSMLVRKMGGSELHAVMAAGLAGGIGLCGGGCGALGAALWIASLERCREPGSKLGFNDPKLVSLMERFLKATDYKFECSEIIGRRFSSLEDHAAYMQDGGCSELLEVLATK